MRTGRGTPLLTSLLCSDPVGVRQLCAKVLCRCAPRRSRIEEFQPAHLLLLVTQYHSEVVINTAARRSKRESKKAIKRSARGKKKVEGVEEIEREQTCARDRQRASKKEMYFAKERKKRDTGGEKEKEREQKTKTDRESDAERT